MPKGWHSQTNEKGENGTHRLSLTKKHTVVYSQKKKGRIYRPRIWCIFLLVSVQSTKPS